METLTLGSSNQHITEMSEEIVTIPKEVILISLVSQEQALYNPKDENYRNTQCKDAKWQSIAENIGWSEAQAKSKWKALRDQYCRELKRSKFNAKANVKWKYFKELDFLRPYALSRQYLAKSSQIFEKFNAKTPFPSSYRPRNLLCIDAYSAAINNNNNNTSSGGSANNSLSDTHKFPTVKIEGVAYHPLEFTAHDTETEQQLDHVMQPQQQDEQPNQQQHQEQQHQDGNWNYLNATADTNNLQNQQSSTNNTDEALYSAFVDCVAAAAAGQMGHSHQEEEDDDPIHTFLNIESYFEKELIAIIQQEDILYNSYHPQYRNIKQKMEVWDEISRKLKRTVRQCRLKWKALRDQYIREHKRLKNRENVEALPRWKHYDALNFLHKFIKHKTDENKTGILKSEIGMDIEEQQIQSGETITTPLHSPESQEDQMATQNLPALTGPHDQQQELNESNMNANSLCLVDTMDIEEYITGGDGCSNDSRSVNEGVEAVVQNGNTEDLERKPKHQFVVYAHHSHSNKSNNNNSNPTDTHLVGNEGADLKDIKNSSSPVLLMPRHLQQKQLSEHTISIPTIGIVETASLANATVEVLPQINHTDFKIETAESTSTSSVTNGNLNTECTTVTLSEDDEVGAFFKAVAMKIRNAKMSPVAFTDLQIDILRVINSTLRPH